MHMNGGVFEQDAFTGDDNFAVPFILEGDQINLLISTGLAGDGVDLGIRGLCLDGLDGF